MTDDDDPFVEVQFAQNSYTVPEGGTQAVTVTLSADPERTVDIPLVATAQGGADITDYSVPLIVTFSIGQNCTKSVTFTRNPGRRWTTTTRACGWPSARSCRLG